MADDPLQALVAMVDAWATDIEAGHDTFLLAWRRTNVAALNRLARDQARQRGWLHGPDLQTPDGRLFAVGDTVVTLAPNHRGGLVTSERSRVVAIHPDAGALTIETADDRHVTLHGPALSPDRLAHGYALTGHREQGATSDRTHYYSDGGGRELAYVALSRARHHTRVWTVADDLDHALNRIRDDWSIQQHETWLTPTTEDGHDPRHEPAAPTPTTRADLEAELADLQALAPPDVSTDIVASISQLARLRADRVHLTAGTGPYQDTAAGRAARHLHDLDADLTGAQMQLTQARRPWDRRRWRGVVATLEHNRPERLAAWHYLVHPEATRLDRSIATAQGRLDEFRHQHQEARAWHCEHPEHAHRVRALRQALLDLGPQLSNQPSDLPEVSPASDREPDEGARIHMILKRLRRDDQMTLDRPDAAQGLGL